MKRLLCALFLPLLLGSCAKESPRILVDGGPVKISLTATLPEMQMEDNGDETKASTLYTVRIKWAAGDKLSVLNLTSGKILGGYLMANSSGSQTTFSGSVSGSVTEGDVLCYLYPYQENDSEQPLTGITVDMSAQSGLMNSVPLCVSSTAVAHANSFSDLSLSFNYLMSYFMVGLSDMPASTQLKGATITNVVNSFDLSVNASHNGLDITRHTGDIRMSLGQNASATGVRTIYAAIPGSPAVASRRIIVETSTTTLETKFGASALNNGTAYNTNVSGFLVDDLVMSDPSMREYCLAHFDSNGDGKLSMVEIAGVTTFPDQNTYPIPTDVRRFNELEYFIGLTSLPSFKNCKQLEQITIPRQISSISDETFSGCSTLTKLTLKPEEPPVLGSNVFSGVPGSIILVVPDDSVIEYQTADGWSDWYRNFRTDSNENDSSVEIDTEDEESMKEERIEIEIR